MEVRRLTNRKKSAYYAFALALIGLTVAPANGFAFTAPIRSKAQLWTALSSPSSTFGTSPVLRPPFTFTTSLTTSSARFSTPKENEPSILPAAVAVGSITAALGFVYGKVLGAAVHGLWTTVPALLVKKGIQINPAYYIPAMFSLGGLTMGILSAKLPATFTVADFVSAFSAVPNETLPSSRSSLLPLLLLSLVTSTFGFSVGPEAPMVCAGGLIGASLARRWFDKTKATTLAYAGAAGALTAFMGIPIAGSIFALELTRSSASLSSAEDVSPAVAASVAGILVLRAILMPTAGVGGHFDYGSVGSLSGRSMIFAALASSACGAVIGTLFHKAVATMKGICWKAKASPTKGQKERKEVIVKTIIGLMVGLLSVSFPQTMFWGEGSLQCMVDGQKTAFAATKHGLPAILTSAAKVNPSLPFATAGAAFQVGIAKLVAIAFACAGKFPGGIIFPLFFAAAPIGHGFGRLLSSSSAILPVVVMCLMASTQASVTRTPLATALILSLSASATTELSVMLPACLIASYFGVWLSQLLSRKSYFKYST